MVLLNRKDYISNMKLILADTSKFKKIQIDDSKVLNHLIHMENKIVELLKRLKEKQEISDKVYKELYPTGSKPGILYGLCKIHKSIVDGVPPFRPILSAIGTPTYKLAKFFVPLLEPLTYNQYAIKDSFSFCEELKHFNTNLIMASFDIESLFTKIPLQETIDLCVQKLVEDKNFIDGLSKDSFREMLTVTMTEYFILFDNKYYEQHDGVAMGSPLGPTFANIFLCVHEILWLEKCPPEFRPVIYKRYVDDIFLLFQNINQIEKFKYYLNLQHANIKFTSETEMNNSLSFLDIKIVRENNKFTTSVYRKPTFSGVFTNFESFIPNSYKYALIFTLLHRAFKLCSNFEQFHQEIENLKNIFRKNGYPVNFTDFCIKKYLNNLYVKKEVYLLAPKKQLICVLPFLGKKSLQLRSRLVNSVNKTVRFCNLKVVFRSQRKLNTLFRFKDSLNKKIRSFLVYRYTCSNCNVTYYGKTYRHFFTRAAEHMGISNLTGKRLKNIKDSAVSDHLLQCNCAIDFDHFDILATDVSKFNLFRLNN